MHLLKGMKGSLRQAVPVLALMVWAGLLLTISNGHQSLMAHDEGWYALQSRWMVETGDWITPRWWGTPIYDRVVGLHWMISSLYLVFGISDQAARLSGLFASLLAVWLTYAIGTRLLTPLAAWVGAAILSTCPLWLQYSRMASQDIPLTCLELLGIWALLQAERQDRRLLWGAIAGLAVGLGCLFKSIMIFLPIVALSPYLLWQHRRHHHLTNPALYLGLILGFLPIGFWLKISYESYGAMVFQGLFGHLFNLGTKQFHQDANVTYYFWNIPANAFPWPLLALIGLTFLTIEFWQKYRTTGAVIYQVRFALLVLYPLLLFLLLTAFSTRTPYYALQLYPWIGLLAGTALVGLIRHPPSRLVQGLNLLFSGLALVLIGVAISVGFGWIQAPTELRAFSLPVFLLGLGWLLLPVMWWWQQQRLAWVATWIMAPWIALMASGVLGLWGNYSADLKTALSSPPLVETLQEHPIDVVATLDGITGDYHKTWVLLSFYTPRLGEGLSAPNLLKGDRYAWISPQFSINPSPQDQIIGTMRDWKLVHHQD